MTQMTTRRTLPRPRRSRIPFALGLGLLLALVCGPLVRARAADEPPTIAPFTTAHVRIAGSISAQGQERPVQGEGDIDANEEASRLTVTLLGETSETIAIDGRIYSRNATTGRWEYTDGGGGGFDPARLAIYDPARIRAAGKLFTRVGPETDRRRGDDALANRCRSARAARGDPRRGRWHRAARHRHDEPLAR